mmetsp:Transcript_40985/g.127743  ORF Transcript_40985/g.127743 Transcript_40985/m.127743 type:complete len:304 (+) Transcript_40985:2079-2990(+)
MLTAERSSTPTVSRSPGEKGPTSASLLMPTVTEGFLRSSDPMALDGQNLRATARGLWLPEAKSGLGGVGVRDGELGCDGCASSTSPRVSSRSMATTTPMTSPVLVSGKGAHSAELAELASICSLSPKHGISRSTSLPNSWASCSVSSRAGLPELATLANTASSSSSTRRPRSPVRPEVETAAWQTKALDPASRRKTRAERQYSRPTAAHASAVAAPTVSRSALTASTRVSRDSACFVAFSRCMTSSEKRSCWAVSASSKSSIRSSCCSKGTGSPPGPFLLTAWRTPIVLSAHLRGRHTTDRVV